MTRCLFVLVLLPLLFFKKQIKVLCLDEHPFILITPVGYPLRKTIKISYYHYVILLLLGRIRFNSDYNLLEKELRINLLKGGLK